MSSHPEVIRVCNSSDVNSDLINAAKSECDVLDLSTTASFKTFPPGELCRKVIESVKQKSTRKFKSSSVIVLLPGATTQYLQSPCIIIPINKDGLPTTVINRDEKVVTVNWDAGRAWDVLQDIRLAPVNKEGGTLLEMCMG